LLNRCRQVKSTVSRCQNELDFVPSDDADVPPPAAQYGSSIVELNSTSEFCRSLGEIPTLGIAGSREDDDDEMNVCILCTICNC